MWISTFLALALWFIIYISMKKKIFFLITAVFLISIAFLVFFDRDIQEIKAAVPFGNQELHGWAWSDTVGWVNFNCNDSGAGGCTGHDYQVSVNPNDGKFSGYAWSEHIGWIKFFEDTINDLNKDPDGGSGGVILQDLDSDGIGELFGWARACVAAPDQVNCSGAGANTNSGGWDGWIKMDHGKIDEVNVDLLDGYFHDYAWGSDVIGWLQFDPTLGPGVNKDIANIDINMWVGSPGTKNIAINESQSTIIGWNTTDATKCTPSLTQGTDPLWISTNIVIPVSTYNTSSLNEDTIYKLNCVGISGFGMESVNIGIVHPGFSLSLSTSTIKAIIFGKTLSADSSTTTITVNSTGGYTGQVQLSVSSGMPFGATEIFNPSDGIVPVNGTADFSLLNVLNDTSGVITIHGEDINDGGIQDDIDIYFKVVNYDPNIIEK